MNPFQYNKKDLECGNVAEDLDSLLSEFEEEERTIYDEEDCRGSDAYAHLSEEEHAEMCEWIDSLREEEDDDF